ncbi:cellulose biosynthesis cyclic di-GMP-binding regulatory protein BcsB [Paenibacillus sp. GCM10023252]|uniref:cellulose biosynthesis cyclic di-GMP-binding regulatory protein BcsB n=1 Tax=Paenibacillus sp. GCM10023252 TaxID=3252649 RepID=UPI00360FFA25
MSRIRKRGRIAGLLAAMQLVMGAALLVGSGAGVGAAAAAGSAATVSPEGVGAAGMAATVSSDAVPAAAGSASGKGQGTPQIYSVRFANTEDSLNGRVASRQQYWEIADYWDVSGASITLDYQVTPLAVVEESSATLTVNGVKLHSFRPQVKDGSKQRLRVEVPKELLVQGSNVLSIEANTRTGERIELCTPEDSRDNWLQLYETSRIDVKYQWRPIKASIGDFSERFEGMDTVRAGAGAIAVPEDSLPAELESAVYALSGYAKGNTLKDKTIPLLAFGDARLADKGLVVAIGLYDRLPDELLKQLGTEQEAALAGGKAILTLVDVGQRPTLIITSKEEKMLVRAGRFAANRELMAQADRATVVVGEDTAVASPTAAASRTVALTETGDKLTGVSHQERTYFIRLPANRSLADNSKLSLDFRYAKNLDFSRSMVTVLVDDKPIGSKRLSEAVANGDQLKLPIPKNLDISGNFAVTVAFDLELEEVVCAANQQGQMPWAYVTKDSILQLNTKDRTELLLSNYPYPFLRDGMYNQVGVVVPKDRDTYVYEAISNLFNLLGQSAESNMGEVRFYEGDTAAAEELKDRNLIAIGSYPSNKVIRETNDKLYFRYAEDGSGFVSNEKMSIEKEYGKRIGSLQLLESPYADGHGFMAVTGASSELAAMASKLVATESNVWKVYGDGVLVDRDGGLNAFRFKVKAEQGEPELVDELLERGDVLKFTVAAVLVMVMVLLSLLFLYRKYRKIGGERE